MIHNNLIMTPHDWFYHAMQVNYRNRFPTPCRLLLSLAITSLLTVGGCSTIPTVAQDPVKLKKNEAQSHMNSETKLQPVSSHRSSLDGRKSFRRSVYASTGVGASRLNPENSEIPTWTVSDKVNAGGQISLGADINRHFSLELHSADLGSAGIEKFGGSQRGRINYHMFGGSALWYIGKNRHRNKRRGFTGFGRVGVARMDNSPVGNAPYTQRNSTQLLAGAGLEYSTKIGLALRGEVISFDSDAQYAQLGLLYRLGRKPRQRTAPIVAAKKEETITPVITPPLAAAVTPPSDADKDGVIDTNDQCLSSKHDVVVDADGCAIFDGVLAGVNFFSTSDRLTPKAKKILDGVANTLKPYPHAKISVNAHTDSRGSESYNLDLSARRAKTVVQYLSAKGVIRENLVLNALGESDPIATNSTVQGRARNRRVEFQVVK